MIKLLFIASLICLIANCNGLICWECEDAYGQAQCLRKGRAVRCESNQDFCHLSLRHGGWGRTPWIEKSCKTLKACADNYVQNVRSAWNSAANEEQIQCNENSPSSVCRCCCSGDLCNQDRTSCLLVRECPFLIPPARGSVDCTNGYNLLSQCTFSCNQGSYLVGARRLTCDAFGSWSHPVPTCPRITCESLRAPEFGSMACNGGVGGTTTRYGLRSRCRFSCQQGYRVFGKPMVECITTRNRRGGVWSGPQPRCGPLQCPVQRALRHGTITCTNQNYVGSACTFQCLAEQGYVLFPMVPTPTVTLNCLATERWDRDRPCCTLPCPPFAIMDFLLILDSSSSVGRENWNRMRNFVISFVGNFSIRDDSANFAAIRYNERVDTANQILFSDYPNDRDGLLRALGNIPYNGAGTRTGRAINYAISNVLPVGNRELARDIVLLITDGISQDRVTLPARRLRRYGEGVDVYVLPVGVDGAGSINLDQINAIAGPGNEERVLRDALENGFDALDDTFARRITGIICDQPCFNPLHNHPDDARDP